MNFSNSAIFHSKYNINVNHRDQFPLDDSPNTFMNVLYLNIQSLRNKLSDFTVYVQNSRLKFHVIVLSETHQQESELKNFNLPGYAVDIA